MPTVVVTGVSSGLGLATAARFAGEGWKVVGSVREPADTRPPGLPASVDLVSLDLAEPASVSGFVATVLQEHGCPDVLVNNAGTLHFGPLESTPDEVLRRVFEVNVFGLVALTLGFIPAMRERGSGCVVNVSSLGGNMVFPFFTAYNSSKHALEGISEGLWHELKPFGIRVKVVRPGYIDTPIFQKAKVGPDALDTVPSEYRDAMREMVEFDRRIARRTPPDEAAAEVLAAVNDASDRFAYPVAAYARGLLAARRVIGDTRFLREAHRRWFG